LGPLHGHTGDHSVFILSGEITIGDHLCRAGSHLVLEWGDMFGPMIAGPDGCTMYGVIAGNGRPFLHNEKWAAFLAERGAQELPVELPEMPPFLGSEPTLVNPVEPRATPQRVE
ncbi:MAG TPA: hypothetical protein VF183_11520, partial [Acidimicrobiales bacterium]